MNRSTPWAMGIALACSATLVGAQTSYRLTVLPERPTSHDSIQLILNGFAETCAGPNFMYPAVHDQQVDIGLSFPSFPCIPGARNPWSLQTVIPPLAAGFYVVHIVDVVGEAAQTIRVVDADEPQALRLLGRFGVSVTWGAAGTATLAHGYPISDESGHFWFFDAANTEVSVKMLDGTAVNGHTWVFLGSMTNVPYVVTVIDYGSPLCQGLSPLGCPRRIYTNPAGSNLSVIDVTAF
ncbi:MAG: hypothetical protein ABI609_09155 [Acidobacteriota bacterium]